MTALPGHRALRKSPASAGQQAGTAAADRRSRPYRRHVAWSVFSSQSVSPSQLESLMQQFGAQPTVFPEGEPEPGSWSVPIAGGELVVSEATGDLRTMPPRMIEAATSLIGTAPVYCLSIFAGAGQSTGSAVVVDDKETAALIRRIVNTFAARWPAVLSDNTTNPMIPLGPLRRVRRGSHPNRSRSGAGGGSSAGSWKPACSGRRRTEPVSVLAAAQRRAGGSSRCRRGTRRRASETRSRRWSN